MTSIRGASIFILGGTMTQLAFRLVFASASDAADFRDFLDERDSSEDTLRLTTPADAFHYEGEFLDLVSIFLDSDMPTAIATTAEAVAATAELLNTLVRAWMESREREGERPDAPPSVEAVDGRRTPISGANKAAVMKSLGTIQEE